MGRQDEHLASPAQNSDDGELITGADSDCSSDSSSQESLSDKIDKYPSHAFPIALSFSSNTVIEIRFNPCAADEKHYLLVLAEKNQPAAVTLDTFYGGDFVERLIQIFEKGELGSLMALMSSEYAPLSLAALSEIWGEYYNSEAEYDAVCCAYQAAVEQLERVPDFRAEQYSVLAVCELPNKLQLRLVKSETAGQFLSIFSEKIELGKVSVLTEHSDAVRDCVSQANLESLAKLNFSSDKAGLCAFRGMLRDVQSVSNSEFSPALFLKASFRLSRLKRLNEMESAEPGVLPPKSRASGASSHYLTLSEEKVLAHCTTHNGLVLSMVEGVAPSGNHLIRAIKLSLPQSPAIFWARFSNLKQDQYRWLVRCIQSGGLAAPFTHSKAIRRALLQGGANLNFIHFLSAEANSEKLSLLVRDVYRLTLIYNPRGPENTAGYALQLSSDADLEFFLYCPLLNVKTSYALVRCMIFNRLVAVIDYLRKFEQSPRAIEFASLLESISTARSALPTLKVTELFELGVALHEAGDKPDACPPRPR